MMVGPFNLLSFQCIVFEKCIVVFCIYLDALHGFTLSGRSDDSEFDRARFNTTITARVPHNTLVN